MEQFLPKAVVNGIVNQLGEDSFTFTVECRTPELIWSDAMALQFRQARRPPAPRLLYAGPWQIPHDPGRHNIRGLASARKPFVLLLFGGLHGGLYERLSYFPPPQAVADQLETLYTAQLAACDAKPELSEEYAVEYDVRNFLCLRASLFLFKRRVV
jgi:hypothetical protein